MNSPVHAFLKTLIRGWALSKCLELDSKYREYTKGSFVTVIAPDGTTVGYFVKDRFIKLEDQHAES